MPLYQIKIDIQENKIDEFVRSLHSLWFKFLKEEGCLSYCVYREFEKENTFCLVGEFATHEAMETHFQTGDFDVLVGAASVLGKAFKMMTTEILAKGGRDLLKSKLASQEKESGLQDHAEHS
jgi:quinol monooxygenase YgiN